MKLGYKISDNLVVCICPKNFLNGFIAFLRKFSVEFVHNIGYLRIENHALAVVVCGVKALCIADKVGGEKNKDENYKNHRKGDEKSLENLLFIHKRGIFLLFIMLKLYNIWGDLAIGGGKYSSEIQNLLHIA